MKLYIEANIGAGKTTFINKLKHKYVNDNNIVCIEEPVDDWMKLKDSNNNNILNMFYHNPKRWAYTFQTNAFISRIECINRKYKTNKINFIERSIYTDKNCFALICKEKGYMNQIEWNLYNNCFEQLKNKFNIEPSGYIYIKTSPETCYERIKKRNRGEEYNITLEYLKDLDDKHDKWLNDISNYVPKLIIDGEKDFENDEIIFFNYIKEIDKFYSKIMENKVSETNNFC